MASSQGSVSLFIAIEVVALVPIVFVRSSIIFKLLLRSLYLVHPCRRFLPNLALSLVAEHVSDPPRIRLSEITLLLASPRPSPLSRDLLGTNLNTFLREAANRLQFFQCHDQVFRLEDELDVDRIPQLTVFDLSRRLDLSVEHSLKAVEICAPGPCSIGALINGIVTKT